MMSCSRDACLLRRSSCSAVTMGDSGLRSSWPSMARNSSLARVAASARTRASSSSRPGSARACTRPLDLGARRVEARQRVGSRAWLARPAASSPRATRSSARDRARAASSGTSGPRALDGLALQRWPPMNTRTSPARQCARPAPVDRVGVGDDARVHARTSGARSSSPPGRAAGSVGENPGAGQVGSGDLVLDQNQQRGGARRAAPAGQRPRRVRRARPARLAARAVASSIIGHAGRTRPTAVQLWKPPNWPSARAIWP